MAAGDLITADWEMEYKGLLIGGESAYSVSQIDGLIDMPDIVTGDQSRLRRHGLRAGDDFLSGRPIQLTVEVYGADEGTFNTAMEAIKLALRPGQPEAPLVMQLPGVAGGAKVQVNVRPRRFKVAVGRDFYYRIPNIVVEFYSTDPRLFANAIGSDSATLPTAGGGLSFNASPDFSFGATSIGGELNLTNDGNFQTPVVFRIDGPVQTPRLIHNGLDKELKINLNLLAGEFLVVDSASRSVLLNGTASRYPALVVSEWFDLEPGNNQISFRGATTAAGSCTATFRSGWV